MPRMALGDTARCCSLASLLVIVGCAQLPGSLPLMPARTDTAFTQADLREALIGFAARATALMSSAGDAIAEETDDPTIRKRTLIWKLRILPRMEEAVLQDDPRAGYLSALTVAVMQRQYLTEGDGRDLFGRWQSTAVSVARQLESDLDSIGSRFLSPRELEQVRADVEALARERPIGGREFAIYQLGATLTEVETSGRFDWVTDIPMSPFRALEGVGSGAAAIHEFNDTAIRFAHIVESLPEQVRWQTELLLYDVEERRSTAGLLASLQGFSESTQRMAAAAQALPDDLRAGLADSQAALAEANRVLEQARGLVEPLQETAGRLEGAGTAWAALFARDPDREPGRPFDVREWEATAREIATAAAELRSLATRTQSLVESQQLAGRLADVAATVDRVEGGAQGLVDAAAWRILQLLVAFFVLLLAYRLVASRLARREQ